MTMTRATHARLVQMADAHRAADEYRAGRYRWKDGGACAVGCSIRDAVAVGLLPEDTWPGDHAAIAAATGTPELAWRLADHGFEALPDAERPAWPPRFMRSARPGRDYSTFSARLMARCADRLALTATRDGVRAVAATLSVLWRRRAAGDEPTESEWNVVRQQADAAWQQAEAARQQADAARQQADAARWQAEAEVRQASAAWWQAEAEVRQASAARWQAEAEVRQASAAWWQAEAAWWQATAEGQPGWRWLCDAVCEELDASPEIGGAA